MERDAIDLIMGQWRTERPDLDPSSMAVVGRLFRLASILATDIDRALKPFGLKLGAFDVLATLRRQGEPFQMTPTELSRSTLLSSGAMTNRIDRLEKGGLVVRQPDPSDRRGCLVTLTAKGRTLADDSIAARFAEGEDVLSSLAASDRRSLAALLKKALAGVEVRLP